MSREKIILKHLKRGIILFFFQSLLLSLLFYISKTREWYFSVFLPLLGVGNLALAWFLYLRKDGFLNFLKKNKAPETMGDGPGDIFAPPPGKTHEPDLAVSQEGKDDLSYLGAFLVSGLLLLAAGAVLYQAGGIGTRYFL